MRFQKFSIGNFLYIFLSVKCFFTKTLVVGDMRDDSLVIKKNLSRCLVFVWLPACLLQNLIELRSFLKSEIYYIEWFGGWSHDLRHDSLILPTLPTTNWRVKKYLTHWMYFSHGSLQTLIFLHIFLYVSFLFIKRLSIRFSCLLIACDFKEKQMCAFILR